DLIRAPPPDEVLSDPEKREAFVSSLDAAAKDIERLLGNPVVVRDPDLFQAVAKTGFDLGGLGALLGGNESAGLGEKIAPAFDEFTRHQDDVQGLDVETGQPKFEYIDEKFSAEESLEVLREHLEF